MKVYKKNKLVYGLYVNDADYPTQPVVDGKRKVCPYYRAWRSMLSRCNSEKVLSDRPTYKDKSVCDDWAYFSSFKSWMTSQVWEGLHLDKDVLVPGNKIYGPSTCAFVPAYINTLINTRSNDRGQYPIGVTMVRDKRMVNELKKPFTATCSSGDSGSRYLGIFTTPLEAHQAWQRCKIGAIEHALFQYKQEVCYRYDIEQALVLRMGKLEFELENNIETKTL